MENIQMVSMKVQWVYYLKALTKPNYLKRLRLINLTFYFFHSNP